MSRKRSITAIDKRIARWQELCQQFPKSDTYKAQLARLQSQRVQAANRIGKPQPANERN